LTGLFFRGKVPNYFALQSKVKQHAIRMKEGYRFSKEDECKSPDTFVDNVSTLMHNQDANTINNKIRTITDEDTTT
jgi:hypothetical protein